MPMFDFVLYVILTALVFVGIVVACAFLLLLGVLLFGAFGKDDKR